MMGIYNLVFGALAVLCAIYAIEWAPKLVMKELRRKMLIWGWLLAIAFLALATIKYPSTHHSDIPQAPASGTRTTASAPAKPGTKNPTGKADPKVMRRTSHPGAITPPK